MRFAHMVAAAVALSSDDSWISFILLPNRSP